MIIDGFPGKTNQYIEATSLGRDFLDGKGGNDVLVGNEGNDLFDGGPGHDLLLGNSGNQQEPCCDDEVTYDVLMATTYEGAYCDESGQWYDKDDCEITPPPPPPPECPPVEGDTFHFRLCDIRAGGNSDLISGWVYDGSHIDIGRDGHRADLTADMFVNGTQAQDANDLIIYNEANGKLWIDTDGSGAKHKMLVARLVDNQSDNPYHPGSEHPTLFWNDVSVPEWLV
jgi:Ca2+-binding RTX toxin-like protein